MIAKISREHINLLRKEARIRYPIEACGILFGIINEETAWIRRIVPLRNMLESKIRFQINPEEFLRAFLEAEKKELQHVGFFHSHPADIKPSTVDLTYMKLWPETVWLIVSSISYEMAAYYVTDGQIRKIPIKVSLFNP